MTLRRIILAAAIAVPLALSSLQAMTATALAQSSPVIVAVVNDQPITEFDLQERIVLLELLGDTPPGGMDKKKALRQMIDDVVKAQEAKRYNMYPSDSDVTDRIKRLADGMKLTSAALLAKLKEKGISEASFRSYLAASMGFSRIIQGKYQQQIQASAAEVDAKTAQVKADYGQQISKIMNDPRMKPITVFSLMEIDLPVEGNDPMLLQSRAIEAQQVLQRLKGCGSLKAASQGVFDVKQGRTFDADSAKMPPPMKAALEKGGVGRAIGPMRAKNGIQLIALCGIRKLVPPKPNFTMPTRDQIERAVINDKYDKLEADYLATIRDKVYVEYRDQSYAQQ